MSEELKVGDRVDIIVKYINKDNEIRENFGSITHIERTYRIVADNGYVAYHVQDHVRKHVPDPKPGDWVMFKNRNPHTPLIFISKIFTSDGKTYWACEYDVANTDAKEVMLVAEDSVEVVPKENK